MDRRTWSLRLSWIALSALVLIADFLTGPAVHFPIGFAIPVVLASWYSGRAWGVALAIALSTARLVFIYAWGQEVFDLAPKLNFIIRMIVLTGLAVLVSYTANLTRQVKVLKGILPTCSACKRMRTEDGRWVQMEEFISERSEAHFSHGLCRECLARLYPDYAAKLDKETGTHPPSP